MLEFVQSGNSDNLLAFSVDLKDLYYYLPHDILLECVEDGIDMFGCVAFQNSVGMPAESFLELLSFYLRSTFVLWNDKPHLQKEGICIRSCIAPILSDIFLAKLDTSVKDTLDKMGVVRAFRYVDDFLFFIDCDQASFESQTSSILSVLRQRFNPLVLTLKCLLTISLDFWISASPFTQCILVGCMNHAVINRSFPSVPPTLN